MFYTIIKKSNWEGAAWYIEYTPCKNMEEATQRVRAYLTLFEGYKYEIKRHRKPLGLLTNDNGKVRFSDGTVAIDRYY